MKIYNSLTRTKDEFIPIKKNVVGMYVCGPTVYDEPHIGHARSAYIFDVIRRYLEYSGYKVKFVRNVTDVDDKIIGKAKSAISSQPSTISLKDKVNEVAQKYLAAYHEDMELLGIGKPNVEPKATEYIPKMIKFIEILIKNGCAYAADGDVYFDIKKARFYGKLSNQNLEKMEAGARITPGERKRDPLDFALWKKAKEDEPSWDSPWGKGRPGWHIECSVMSSDILGGEFDIHGGGIDLIFPHHENEIAQSEGAGKKFAHYWIHNGLLTINSEKMAKSLGNFISIKDFVAKYKDPDYLKLLFLNTHYRHPVDYTAEKIGEMKSQKERFVILSEKIRRLSFIVNRKSSVKERSTINDQRSTNESFKTKFNEAMEDDFNTPMALAALFDLVTYANKIIHEKEKFTGGEVKEISAVRELIIELGGVFGLKLSQAAHSEALDESAVKKLVDDRNKARQDKDFKKSDEIRIKLTGMGIILEDTKDGTVWRRKI